MSKNKAAIPDAWDDDWETLADKPAPTADPDASAPKLSKSQRRAQHVEQQRQLWDSAENPDRFHWLEAQGVVPMKNEFKPQVTLLSRKPGAPTIVKKKDEADVANGVAGLKVDDDEEDSEAEDLKRREAELEERQRKAKIEREEKQRRYAEARERIMGSPAPGSSPSQGSGSMTVKSRESSHGRENRRSRGGRSNARSNHSQPTSSTDQSPARPSGGAEKVLFDPDDMGRRLPKREGAGPAAGVKEQQPLRQPRNPDSARGGFGFGSRGGATIS